MKNTIIILAAAVAMLTAACKKSEILFPGGERYIYMGYKDKADTVFNFSFVSTTEESVDIEIPVCFAGPRLSEDLQYDVLAQANSTLLPGSEYDIPETVFHKEDFTDKLVITIHRTERMKENSYSLRVRLIGNENFRATQTGFLSAVIHVTAKIAKPSWWTANITEFYLGEYGDRKFELFSQQIFTGDFGKLDDSEKRYYAIQFKYWLQENPQTDPVDGTPIKVPIQG